MYTRAAYILDAPNISNVHCVTAMLERCTQWGHPLAANLLLDVYEGRRKGLDAQPEKAAILARHLAEGTLKLDPNHPESIRIQKESMYRYALYCEKGIGRAKSEHDAYEWMLKASNSGYGKARVELARYLITGKGGHKNPKTALKLLKAQAGIDATVPKLFFYMGHIYLSGEGLKKPNYERAFHYFSYGMQFNDADAINNLATMYERGIGTTVNELMALKLYKKAANLGCKQASANMQRLGYMKAGHEISTPDAVRVDNAAMQVIEALPLPENTRRNMTEPFRRHAGEILKPL
jgi:TPR repeat protein